MCNNSVHTAKQIRRISSRNIECLMPFQEIAAVYTKNLTKIINILCRKNTELLIIEAAGTYS
jgi:hypothetical protein